MIENFCGGWPNRFLRLPCRLTSCIEAVKQQVGSKKVLLLLRRCRQLSVCAALLNKALDPKQVYAV